MGFADAVVIPRPQAHVPVSHLQRIAMWFNRIIHLGR